jgi:hypothetical protein
MNVFIHTKEDAIGGLEWHELHDCRCPRCLGRAEHRLASTGYEDIECMQGCGLVWLRGEPTAPGYVIDERPDKRKKPCDRCDGLTIH